MPSAALARLLLRIVLSASADPTVYLHHDQVWIGKGQSLTELAHHSSAKSYPTLSADADQIAYVAQCKSGASSSCPPAITFINLEGMLLYSFPPSMPEADGPCMSILQFDWINKQHVGFACHLNPSLSEYVVTDIATTKPVKAYHGGPFA